MFAARPRLACAASSSGDDLHLLGSPIPWQQPRSALEHFELAIAKEWDLAEELTRQMVGASVAEWDCSNGTSKPSFLARPSQSYAAHKSTATFGRPIIRPNDQFAHTAMFDNP
jgi:hypothetical protein